MSALTFTVPPESWLTSNRHGIHRGQRARIVRELHQLVAAAATVARLRPVTGPVAAEWEIRYPKGVSWLHGDAANAQPTTKAALDALVPRWLPGDGPRHVVAETFRRGPNLDVARLHEVRLTLTPQEVNHAQGRL